MKRSPARRDRGPADDLGFSLVEIAIVTGLTAILAAVSVPILASSMRSLQLDADARNIVTALTNAKLKATSQFTRYQVSLDVSQGQWSLQKYNKTSAAFAVEGATTKLSSGIAHSGIVFQATSATPLSGYPATSSSFIRFNSRGIPIDANGIPTANNVVYLGDGRTDYAVSVSLSGKVQLWKSIGGTWSTQ